ncbi:hypothetical protein BsWGS_25436 [Bradybaena similaris]
MSRANSRELRGKDCDKRQYLRLLRQLPPYFRTWTELLRLVDHGNASHSNLSRWLLLRLQDNHMRKTGRLDTEI